MGTGTKAPFTPLSVSLERHLGYPGPSPVDWPTVLPLPSRVVISFWIPGKPLAKKQAAVGVGKSGNTYRYSTKDAVERELHVRTAFCNHMQWYQRELIPYLPLVRGHAWVECLCLDVPPGHWYPGMRHAKAPDQDNLHKLVKDALGGRGSGRPSLVWGDDCVVDLGITRKGFWDCRVEDPHYPREPGTCATLWLDPPQRHPDFAPAGELVCSQCGKDEFRNEVGLMAHQRRCRG